MDDLTLYLLIGFMFWMNMCFIQSIYTSKLEELVDLQDELFKSQEAITVEMSKWALELYERIKNEGG